jgi:hypothetical protein
MAQPQIPQGSIWTGTPGYTTPLSTYTQQQQGTLNNVLQVGNNQLSKNDTSFAPIEANAQRRFQSQTLPSLAARATTLGQPLGSSGFQGLVNGANADFQSNLDALKAQYNERQQDRTHNLLNMGLNARPFENIYHPAQNGLLQEAAPGAGYALTAAAASTAGAAATAIGAKIAAAGGFGAVLANPWVWGPVLAAAGLYLAYKGGRWVMDKINNPGDPDQQKGIVMPQGQQGQPQMGQQQQQQQGGNFQQMQAPNFALGGAA